MAIGRRIFDQIVGLALEGLTSFSNNNKRPLHCLVCLIQVKVSA